MATWTAPENASTNAGIDERIIDEPIRAWKPSMRITQKNEQWGWLMPCMKLTVSAYVAAMPVVCPEPHDWHPLASSNDNAVQTAYTEQHCQKASQHEKHCPAKEQFHHHAQRRPYCGRGSPSFCREARSCTNNSLLAFANKERTQA